MGVSKNRGTPKWMVKIMEHPIKMDDLGGFPIIFGNTHMSIIYIPTSLLDSTVVDEVPSPASHVGSKAVVGLLGAFIVCHRNHSERPGSSIWGVRVEDSLCFNTIVP